MKKKKNGIFRIIQSIPSPKAEPFKLWLSEVGKERIDEIIDPERTIDRALETYLKKGYKRRRLWRRRSWAGSSRAQGQDGAQR